MDQPENFELLFQKYLENQCSPEEAEWLLAYLKNNRDELPAKLIEEQVAKRLQENHTDRVEVKARLELRLQKILQQIETPVIPIQSGKWRFSWLRIAAAAVIILGLGTGVYFLFNHTQVGQIAKNQPQPKQDIEAPLSAHALIRLSSGQQIILDSAANGTLATQGTVDIKKLDDGQVAYTKSTGTVTNGENAVPVYNALINPKGSKVISLTLADGSRVWLNAASSLQYPTSFTGNERKVTITGEAYFEVSHNASMPFRVVKGDAEVTVLGTHFNVNAYDDEKEMKVTLLEGSVKVSQSGDSRTVRPGEQAVLQQEPGNRTHITVLAADIEQVMAWKNGMFHFEGTNIEDIMRQVGRWYNVDIHYEVPTGNLNFSGIVSRKANVSELLKIMELTGLVHFKIEGDKITVVR